MKKIWLGIDMAKKDFAVAYWDDLKKSSIFLGEFVNDHDGFTHLKDKLINELDFAGESIYIVLEATGGYELRLRAFCQIEAWQVSLPNPKLVRDFARGEGIRHKTDKSDAQILAKYGFSKDPPVQIMLSSEVSELEELQQRLEQLEKQVQAEKNRLKQWQQRPYPSTSVTESMERTIAHLEEELNAVNNAIKAIFTVHNEHNETIRLLRTIPGIGKKNSLPIFIALNRFMVRSNNTGSKKQVVAFLGLDPRPFQSGTTVYKRSTISKMGDPSVRRYLYLGALGGVRGENALKYFYQGLVERNKAKRLALVACARKILVWAFVVFTKREAFNPDLHPIPQVSS